MRCSSAVLALAGAVLLTACGAAAQETTGESSLEVGLWKQLSVHDLLYVPMSVTRADASDHAEALVGVSYDRSLARTESARIGLRYVWKLNPPEGTRGYVEQRVVAELFTRPWPGAKLELLNRARMELRWIEGDPSWRARDRIRLGRVIPRKRIVSIMPYGTAEATYDSRYRSINRLRLSLGAVARLTHSVGVDIYVARQRDTHSDAARLAVAGATLNLYF